MKKRNPYHLSAPCVSHFEVWVLSMQLLLNMLMMLDAFIMRISIWKHFRIDAFLSGRCSARCIYLLIWRSRRKFYLAAICTWHFDCLAWIALNRIILIRNASRALLALVLHTAAHGSIHQPIVLHCLLTFLLVVGLNFFVLRVLAIVEAADLTWLLVYILLWMKLGIEWQFASFFRLGQIRTIFIWFCHILAVFHLNRFKTLAIETILRLIEMRYDSLVPFLNDWSLIESHCFSSSWQIQASFPHVERLFCDRVQGSHRRRSNIACHHQTVCIMQFRHCMYT